MNILTSRVLGGALVKAGIVPSNCRRIVIDVPSDGVVTVHYETLAEESLLDVLTSTIEPVIVGSKHSASIVDASIWKESTVGE